MAHYLFPSFERDSITPVYRRDYACLLTDISRASQDAIEALTTFDRLIRGEDAGAESLGFMAFDAHCEDAACHLRAGMIEEYASRMRSHPQYYTWWLFPAINSLARTRQRAHQMCSQLTQETLQPNKLGLDERSETSQSILDRLGWFERIDYETFELDTQSEEEIHYDHALSDTFSVRTSSRASSVSPELRSSPILSASSLDSSMDSIKSPPKRSIWPINTDWSVQDPNVMIRFLVYSFILSKYKRFHHSEAGGSACLLPQAALAYGNFLIAPYRDFKHETSQPGNVRRVELEFRRLQSWLSDLSCAWLRRLDDQKPGMGSLVAKTVLMSPRGLKVAACFPAYLILRQHLALQRSNVLLIDRHCCPGGLHHNVFRAEIVLDDLDTSYCRPRAEWMLTHLDSSNIRKHERKPTICILGSSFEGPVSAFQARAWQGVTGHDHEECIENERHVARFLATDLDRLITAFYAEHNLYPFPLECSGGEEAFFKDCLYDFEAVETAYKRARCEALRLGVSHTDINVFRPEHVFVETEARLLNRIQTWSPNAELLPFSDGLVDEEFVKP